MKHQVAQAVEELNSCFRYADVVACATGDGGAVITIDPIDLGPKYKPSQTWMKFAISFQYPYSDIYPLFVSPDLARADGRPHGEEITMAKFEDEPALQVSRRSNHLNPKIDTAALKVIKVIEWLKSR